MSERIMKTLRLISVLLLAAVLFCLPAAAKGGIETRSYSYSADASEVDVYEVFLPVYENDAVDIALSGENADWYFYYENVYRNTEKWMNFSSAVTVDNAPALPGALSAALNGTKAVLLDFRDSDLYPGPAEVTVHAGLPAAPCALYEYAANGTDVSLIPVVRALTPSADGSVTLTLTEAHDFLVLSSPDDSVTAALDAFTPAVSVDNTADAGTVIRTVVFTVLAALILAGLLCLVTVKLLKAKRDAKKKLPAKASGGKKGKRN